MHMTTTAPASTHPKHAWLKTLEVSFVPGPMSAMLEELVDGILNRFKDLGHTVVETPTDNTKVLFTTAPFGEPLPWRQSLFFTARHRFGLKKSPTLYTIIQISPKEFDEWIAKFRTALAKNPPDEKEFQQDGLSSTAPDVLIDQGARGGPILSLSRMLQAQSKSIRVILAVGDEHPERVYHFDLVGAYPASINADPTAFYSDIVLRIVTTESTWEVNKHQVAEPKVTREEWNSMSTPEAMKHAGQELGERGFFTDMVQIENLVQVPAVTEGVARQYSEGCYATWDPQIHALVTTVTGSARPVHKGKLTDDDLALITAVKPDGSGAVVRHVEGKENDPPSVEAVEMMDMDSTLPHIKQDGVQGEVPIIRSKLHGHRGIKAFNPNLVEYVPLDPPYYHYLVSCATEAQARGIKAAFSRSETMRNPEDPRQIAFTVLPGHGVVMAEKWKAGNVPFQTFWEAMDSGDLEIDPHVPQGEMAYVPAPNGRLELKENSKV